jgi:putative intracellular protease/amidase
MSEEAKRKVLLIVANPMVSEVTGWPIGFWASELVHPWYEFRQAGYDVTVASPYGGRVEIDGLSDPRDESGYSASDVLSRGFLEDPELPRLLDDTPRLADLDQTEFDAIVVCGGQAPMFQFRDNKDLQDAIRSFYESGRPTASLCHGVSALVEIELSDGTTLIEGKRLTGFSNAEEDAANEAAGQRIQPWRIEDAVRERGASYVDGGLWEPFAVADGNLITGQQQFSGRAVAERVISALEA